MTTQLLIVNFGPQDVDVFAVDRGSGRNQPPIKRLKAGDHMDIYVHLYQDVYMMEVSPLTQQGDTNAPVSTASPHE